MIQLILKLFRLRFRLWWNTLKNSSWGRKIGLSIAALFGFGLFIFVGVISWFFISSLTNPVIMKELESAGLVLPMGDILAVIPVLLLIGLFLSSIVINFGTLLQTLYLSQDMEFLLVAPLPPRVVFFSKLVQAVLPGAGLFMLAIIPGLIGLGLSQGYTLLYYPLLLVLVPGVVIAGAGLASLIVMFIVRIVDPRRAAELLGFVGGMVGLVCSQSGQFARFADDTDSDVIFGQMGQIFDQITPLLQGWNPLAWPGLALTNLGAGNWLPGLGFTALAVLAIGGIIGGTMLLAETLYFSGWARVQVGTRAKKKKTAAAPQRRRTNPLTRVSALLPRATTAIISKDFQLYRRDLRQLSQLTTPIIFAVIWTILALTGNETRTSDIPAQLQTIRGLGTMFIALFIAWSFTMRFGLGAFSMEGKHWWILKTSPVQSRDLLLGKYLIALIPSVLLAWAYLLVISAISGSTLGALVYQLFAIVLIIGAMASLMLALGIWGARFDWDNPQQMTSGGLGCLSPLFGMAFLGMSAGAFLLLPNLANFLNIPVLWGYVAGAFLGFLLCGVVGTVPLFFAVRRIPRLGDLD